MSKKYVSVLEDSAATPGYRIIAPEDYVYTENGTKKVKKIDSKADKKVPATAGNLATLDATGNLADSGKQTTDFMNSLPTAYEASGSATKTVTKVTQAKTGAVAVTYSDIQSGTTSQKGLVQLEDSTSSTSVTKAATPNSVKSAYDLANGKYSKPSGGIPSSDMDSTVQASLGKADTAIQGVKLNGSTLTPSSAKVVDLGDLKTKQTAVSDPSASGTTITAIATISQDANGVITATKKTIQSASQSQDGVMSAADKKKLDGIATGAEVNQNAFSNVKVGDVTVAADAKTDTLTLAAGSNVTITPDATNDKITIAAKDTTYTADAGIRLDGTVFKHTNSVSGGTVGPTTDTAGATLSVPYVTYDSQGHVTASGTRTHNVGTASTSGAGIVQLQDSIDATATKAATPNAVKKAIEALDVSSVGGSGKYISAISESDGKISATSTTMDTTPTASSTNAVTSGGVKTELDKKSDKDNTVSICDGYAQGNVGKWYKIADTVVNGQNCDVTASFSIATSHYADDGYYGKLMFSFRHDTSGRPPKRFVEIESSRGNTGKVQVYVVTRGAVTGDVIYEIWVSNILDVKAYLFIRLLQSAIKVNPAKNLWNFYQNATASDTAPQDDSSTNTYRYLASELNWVKSVKIGSGSELKNASGNVSIPVDSTPTASSTNLMTSGAIKTALDGKAPTSHASSATTYGVGTTANYGHMKLDNSTPLKVASTSTDGVATGKAHKHNNLESVARADVTTVDLDHIYTNSRAHMIFSQITSDTSTTHDPGDGYMLTFMWDNSSKGDAQLFIPNVGTSANNYGRLKIRYCNNSAWGDWEYPKAAQNAAAINSSDNLDNFKGTSPGDMEAYRWTSSSPPTGASAIRGDGNAPGALMVVYQTITNYSIQVVYTAESGIFYRYYYGASSSWTAWRKVITSADTMTGATSSAAGASGLVPAPTTGQQNHVLLGGGGWTAQSNLSAGAISRTLASSGTISATNIVNVTGSTDGFKMDYSAASSDAGKMTIYTTDDSNAAISIGNNISGTYKEAISIVNGSATVTGSLTGNASSATILNATASNEINFGKLTTTTVWFNYRKQGDDASSSNINAYYFGNRAGDVTGVTLHATAFSGTAYYSSNTKVTTASTTKTYLAGATATNYTSGAQTSLLADTGVYLTTTSGELNATQYKVNEHCTMKYNSTKSSLDFTFS